MEFQEIDRFFNGEPFEVSTLDEVMQWIETANKVYEQVLVVPFIEGGYRVRVANVESFEVATLDEVMQSIETANQVYESVLVTPLIEGGFRVRIGN